MLLNALAIAPRARGENRSELLPALPSAATKPGRQKSLVQVSSHRRPHKLDAIQASPARDLDEDHSLGRRAPAITNRAARHRNECVSCDLSHGRLGKVVEQSGENAARCWAGWVRRPRTRLLTLAPWTT